jgi:hypothetical protein
MGQHDQNLHRHVIAGHFVVDLGHSSIRILDPVCLKTMIPDYNIPALPFMAAFTVQVADLQATRDVLTENNIPFAKDLGSILVYPEYACGSAVIFASKDH